MTGPWCCCRQPQGDRFMIECDHQGEKCFHWYHGNFVGITPAEGRRLESQGEHMWLNTWCTVFEKITSNSGNRVTKYLNTCMDIAMVIYCNQL